MTSPRSFHLSRQASLMRYLVAIVALILGLPVAADQRSDYESAKAKWRSAGLQNYTFTYRWHGAVVIVPACADATIRVRVRGGVGGTPAVVRGSSRCPRGTKGAKSIGFSIPSTIDEAFQEMSRYIANPPVPVRITTTYDDTYGVPTSYFVEKLEFEDNDEGFKITSFKVQE
jgi:hypothetical protein